MLMRYGSSIFLVLFAVYALTMTVPYGYASLGLDPSWNLAINLLIQQGANFGKDVAFTYGPLGFLNYRIMPEGYSIYWFFAFDLALVGMATASVAYAMRQAGKYAYLVAILAVMVIYPEGLFADRVFSLLFYEFAFLLYALQERRFWALILATAIALLLFFIKVNVLFIAGPYFMLVLVYAGWKRIFSPVKLGVLAVLYVLSLCGLAAILQVDLWGYIRNSIALTDGYIDAMSSFSLFPKEFFILAMLEILFGLGFVLLLWRSWKSWRETFVVLFTSLLLLALAFKQSHVGIGFAGFRNFFQIAPLIVCLYVLFVPKLWDRKDLRIAGGMLAIYLLSMAYTGYGLSERSWRNYVRSRPVPHMNLSYYAVPYTWYDYAKNFDQHALDLPDTLRRRLGNASVDFLQHDLGYVFFNCLHYRARPVIQSYSAYTPELIRINGAHYRSNQAPDWVFYKLEPFRNQNPFWMDSEVTLELLKRYQLQAPVYVHGDTLQLFKRGGGLFRPKAQEIQVPTMRLGQGIAIPEGGLVRLQVDARLNVWGQLMRLFAQPPYLYAKVRYADGQERRFRVIPPVLKAGIWVGARVETQAELRTFFLTSGRGNVAAEQLVLESPMPWAWQ